MRLRCLLIGLLLLAIIPACTHKNEEPFSTVKLAWNQHAPHAFHFYLFAAQSTWASTLHLEVAFHTPMTDEQLLDLTAGDSVDAAMITTAQALLLLNANPAWRLIADLGPTAPLAILSRDESSWRAQRQWVNFVHRSGRLNLAYWAMKNGIEFSELTINEAPPKSTPASNPGTGVLQLSHQPLKRQVLAKTDLRIVDQIDQHLLLLGNPDFLQRRPIALERLLTAWKQSFTRMTDRRADVLRYLSDNLRTDPNHLAKLLPANHGNAGAAFSRTLSPAGRKIMEEMICAGKKQGMLRQSFNLSVTIPPKSP